MGERQKFPISLTPYYLGAGGIFKQLALILINRDIKEKMETTWS